MKKLLEAKAAKAIGAATEINMRKTHNLAMYGEAYSRTLEYAVLELNEKMQILKFEIYKGIHDKFENYFK